MDRPIGIFDSGLGGLTVFQAIRECLPNESLIYLGDTARLPYGVKSAQTVTRYSQEICDFLLRQDVKAIVVACNTASALALPKLQKWYQVPLLGVLKPGALAAVQVSSSRYIGVIGTEATVRSGNYQQEILTLIPEAKVYSQACPLFVPLVEAGWVNHEITRRTAEIYLKPLKDQKIDTLILGCTHYPLLKPILQDQLGSTVKLVDSAHETAQALKDVLIETGLLYQGTRVPSEKYFATDAPEKMKELSSQFLNHPLENVEHTDLLLN